jgi:hypothetical protein
MIDFLNNDLGDILKRTKVISESVVWFQAFDPTLKKKILDWIRNDQLQKGINDEEKIIGLYSELTEIINPEKVAGTPYTLKDTGDFYKSLFIDVLNNSFEVDGDGDKTEATEYEFDVVNLFELHGDGIVGLTEKNKVKLSEELTLKYIEYAKSILRIN